MNPEVLNPNLKDLPEDYLYHLGLSSKTDLKAMFGDTKYVCMGGSPVRAEVFAKEVAKELGVPEVDVKPIGKTERFSLYKVGPVISVSHGMGMPSLSILMHEITKLLHYAGVEDPAYLRLGTSGGVGVRPGTVVLTQEALNGKLEPVYKLDMLGKTREYPTKLDRDLTGEISRARGDIAVALGKTIGTDCFYEGQGRLDGALDPGYTEKDKMDFLGKAYKKGVRNFEMEAPQFAAFCIRAKIRAAIMCVTLLDRLKGDQVTSTPQELGEFSDRTHRLAMNFIKHDLDGRK